MNLSILLLLIMAACTYKQVKKANPYTESKSDDRAGYKKILPPLSPGTSFQISQGAFGCCTHNITGYEYSWDFDVPYGTEVIAVESGKVIQVWEPEIGGGCNKKYNESAHNIKVLHDDGTVAQYVHIKSRVKIGELVKVGQLIAVTANNGFHCEPQLHFSVFENTTQTPENGRPRTIPLLFKGFPEGGIAEEGLIDQIKGNDNKELDKVIANLDPEDTVQKSLIQIISSEHRISIQPKSLEVCSELKVKWHTLPNDLLIITTNEEVPYIHLKSLSIDNADMKFSLLRRDIPTFAVSTSSTKQSLETHSLRYCYDRTSPENKSGLKRITTADLLYPARLITKNKQKAYDLRPVSFFSFGDVSNTRFILSGVPQDWTLLASSPHERRDKALITHWLKAGRFTTLIIDTKLWNITTFESSGSHFQLLVRKNDPVLQPNNVEKAVRLIWPKYVQKFGNPTSHIVIADLDWDFISGGLVGNNLIGLFSLPKISPDIAKAIGKDLSWKPGTSTRQFIEFNYRGSKSPWNDYLIAMVAHELAHFYFGLGKTTEYATQIHDMWFSLGMGMVYDRLVTEQLIGRPDIFFDQVEKKWRHQFHKNPKVDQRLIKPNTRKDMSANLSRSHVYAHGKASYVLRDLRNRLGKDLFDDKVRLYIENDFGGYPAFRELLANDSLELVKKWERDWGIGF